MENLKIEYVPIDSITPYEGNAKLHPAEQIEQIKRSIQDNGMNDPIGIWHDTVVEGHGRLIACKELGMTEVPVIRLDHMTDEQRRQYMLIHNQTTMNSGWDFDILGDELESLADFDASFYGFDEGSIADNEERKVEEAKKTLAEEFIVPPLSILDVRQGYWQQRKKAWKTLIKDDGTSREGGTKIFESRNKFVKKTGNKVTSEASILDPVLCEVLLTWFLPKDETPKVFDCFAGDPEFGFVSGYLGCEYKGTELRNSQAKFNQRICSEYGLNSEYFCDDARNIDKHLNEKSQDLFFSCPPYYNLEVYSDSENDASNQPTYEEFYKIIDESFTKSCKLLKENRFAVIVCQDVRDKLGGFYGFQEDIIQTFKKNGFCLYNRIVLLRQISTGALLARTPMNISRKVRTCHEDVLVFLNGDPNAIIDEETAVDEFYDLFARRKQNIEAHDSVLVFFNGNQQKIKKDFGQVEERK